MKDKIFVVFTTIILCAFGMVHAQDVVQISDTQVFGGPDDVISDGETLEILDGGDVTFTEYKAGIDDGRHLIVYPGGKVTFEDRVNFNEGGMLTMYGGEFYALADVKFPDNDTGVPVSITLYGGYMKCDNTQSMRERLSTLYIGGGVFETGGSSGSGRDPEDSSDWDIQPIPPYGPIVITDLGDGWKQVTAVDPRDPDPANGSRFVPTSQPTLSWTNPDPNVPGTPVFCDVYLGTEPNLPGMDKVTLAADVSSVELTAANFPKFAPLENRTMYYWIVDVHDPSMDPPDDLIPGATWNFFTNDNEAPTVGAGLDQAVWLGKSGTAGQEVVSLQGAVDDDGLPNPPATTTVIWTQVDNGAPTVTISPDNTVETTVTLTERGVYEFMLMADDGNRETADTVVIAVGDDSCDASHVTGTPYDAADQNQDCIVDLEDFASLFAASWLNCTNTLAECDN